MFKEELQKSRQMERELDKNWPKYPNEKKGKKVYSIKGKSRLREREKRGRIKVWLRQRKLREEE